MYCMGTCIFYPVRMVWVIIQCLKRVQYISYTLYVHNNLVCIYNLLQILVKPGILFVLPNIILMVNRMKLPQDHIATVKWTGLMHVV